MINSKESNFVSAVVYLHKDEKNAVSFLDMLATEFVNNFKKSEIICVNDGIGGEILDSLKVGIKEKFSDLNITIINMGFIHGLEASMNAGIDLSIGDFVFEFDSCYVDYNRNLIMDVYYKSLEGYDIVSAVPPKKGSKFTSKIFYGLYNRFSDSNEEIRTERFSIISRRAINRVSAYSKIIPYRKAVYTSSGLKIAYLDYETSKANVGIGKIYADYEKNEKAVDALILFTNVAYKVAITCAILMLIFMFGTALYTVVAYLGQNKPVEGWAPLMGLISVGFFAVFLLFSIIIKYLDVLLKLIFKRQKYLVASVEKL